MRPATDEKSFIELFETFGPQEAARKLNVNVRNVLVRRRNIEKKYNIVLKAKNPRGLQKDCYIEHPARRHIKIKDGHVLVGSDSHYWPDSISTAHRAFLLFCKELKPAAIIKNGDELDGASISRHAPIGWEHRPSLVEEIETTGERLEEIHRASPNSPLFWPLGNHDGRFSTRLASVAPEYAKVKGVQLKDHFPGWQPCWSVWINDQVVIKHRFKGGVHATHNNTLYSGKTMVTGHLHSQKVTPFTDYNGDRWGVDAGMIADPWGPQFEGYMEDNARNWRSGFCLLTFRNGELLQPEVIRVIREGEVDFRGSVIRV